MRSLLSYLRNYQKSGVFSVVIVNYLQNQKTFKYEWITYKDPNIPLIDSDLTLINKNKVNISDNNSIED